MNVIETMRGLVESFPKISEICDSIHVDFADPEPTSYGLASVGDVLLSEDILGNQLWKHNFMLYSTFSSINDYERLVNSGLLQELTIWLSKQEDLIITQDVGEETLTGIITKITAGNAMLYSVPQENTADGVQYQLSISADYKIFTKGMI